MKSKVKASILSITFCYIALALLNKYNLRFGFSLLILMLLFLYYTQALLEIFIYIIINKKINYLILYPFSYDGKIKFAPIKLLYKSELYFNKLSGNLFVNIENNLDKKVLELIYIEYVSKFIAAIILIFLLNRMDIFILKEVIILISGMILPSFIYEDIQYNSLFIVYRRNEIIEKLLSFFYIKENNYFIASDLLKTRELNEEYLLDILISLNKNAIVEEVKLIDIKYLDDIIKRVLIRENNITLMEDVKVKNIYYLIGILGKKYDEESYLDYSYDYTRKEIKEIIDLENESIIDLIKTKNSLIHFQNYLIGREKINDLKKYIYYYDYPVFYKDYIFNEILYKISRWMEIQIQNYRITA